MNTTQNSSGVDKANERYKVGLCGPPNIINAGFQSSSPYP
jgi:hypothetical protein